MQPLESVFKKRLRQRVGDLAPPAVLVRRVATRAPWVSLTFDDGPDERTPELLDILDDTGLLATFFVLGKQAARHGAFVEDIVARGHEIASHGWSHRKLPEMSFMEIAAELERTQTRLPPALGRKLFRPPHGAISLSSLGWTASLGYTTVLWSFDSLDSRHLEADDIVERLQRRAPCQGDIFLLHEGERATRKALPAIASVLRARGLHSVPVSTLVASRVEPF